jgi:hypothetical protein
VSTLLPGLKGSPNRAASAFQMTRNVKSAAKIDLSFEDIGPQSLKNITEPMRAWRLQIEKNSLSTTPKKTAAETAQPLALPDKPSIAVLPFQNMSGDPEQEYFADGMVETSSRRCRDLTRCS